MMVEDLRSAFQELVTETDWMDSETQVLARLHLGLLTKDEATITD